MAALLRCARVAWTGVVLLGCAEHAQLERAHPAPSYEDFAQSAYPILLRDCGFVACHGSAHRPLQVYGPGRTRLDPTAPPSAPATSHELEASYARALAMLVSDQGVDRSLLLTKPLASAAGGQGHRGTDLLGRNVYSSRSDPAYVALRLWSLGMSLSPSNVADAGVP